MSNEVRYGRGDSTPHTVRQHDLEEFKARFRDRTNSGEDLLRYLERSECGVWRCEQDEVDLRRWWLNVTLPTNVAEMFDAHLEIQLVYAEYQQVEPRLLELIQRRIGSAARVDHGLFMIASLDKKVDRLLRRRRGEFAGIDLHLGDLGTGAPDIRHRMTDVLTSVDHYDMTRPVHDPAGFFGRTQEFQQIISAIERGQSVGVFGLRKTGKTSLLNYVAGRRRAAQRPVVWVDISGLASADDFRVRLLEGAWQSVASLNPPDGMPRLRSLNRVGELKVDIDALRLHWLRDLEVLSRHADGRFEVFIDEIDQIHPDRSHLGAVEANKMLVAVTQLRGMVQSVESVSGMVLICAGVDPALFERPLLGSGSDNLLYKLVRLMYLAPLTRDEMQEMVRDLGRRMGVRVRDHKVIDFLFDEYGGHALLTRKACSLAAQRRSKDEIPWHMTLEAVEAAAQERGDGTPFQQAGEILTSFSEWFPDEAGLLRELWSPDPEEREFGSLLYDEDNSRLAHAAPYGIVVDRTTTPRIRAVERSVRTGV
ncbi:ATPase family protein associated with various cellular activities (AAA) [Promicromonospora sp. AC04]|uniref:AAA family ATPase n=1 Tax=Promicromonospora sp. AC04 TaxID=2135723 RepID=UPI000D33C7A0|nr:AAA family ATPase [Promicromonospora sp. AC04]PUB32452.1 ATPase family protein associated with various cellular activities (AAA) [Promicromonospora sp. AC04]